MRFIPFVLLAACAPETDALVLFPEDSAAPEDRVVASLPVGVLLEAVVNADGTLLRVSNAGGGAKVAMINGDVGVGPCPKVLGGPCLGLTSPVVVATAVSDLDGVALFDVTDPLAAPAWQAVVQVGTGAEASPVVEP